MDGWYCKTRASVVQIGQSTFSTFPFVNIGQFSHLNLGLTHRCQTNLQKWKCFKAINNHDEP